MVAGLALGTVQFGLSYGVANATGQATTLDAVEQILSLCRTAGIDTLDTAIAYGAAETVLGQFDLQGFKIVTKLPGLAKDQSDIDGWVWSELEASLGRLGVPKVDSLLLHRPGDLLGPKGPALSKALERVLAQGLVRRIGVSVYSCAELDQYLSLMPIGLVQLPFNVLDTDLIAKAPAYKSLGLELHTRSAFLQGLLLMSAQDRLPRFARWQDLFDQWDTWVAETGQSAAAACLNFTRHQTFVDKVVIGVQDPAQLQELLALPVTPPHPLPVWGMAIEPELINPSLWTKP